MSELFLANTEIEKSKQVIKELAVKFKLQYDKLVQENNQEAALKILEFNNPYLLAFTFDDADIEKIADNNLQERTTKISNGIRESINTFNIRKINQDEFDRIANESMSVDVANCGTPGCSIMGGKKTKKSKNKKKRTYKKR